MNALASHIRKQNLKVGSPLIKQSVKPGRSLNYHGYSHVWCNEKLIFREMFVEILVCNSKSVLLRFEPIPIPMFQAEIVLEYRPMKSIDNQLNQIEVWELFNHEIFCGTLTINSLTINMKQAGCEVYFEGENNK